MKHTIHFVVGISSEQGGTRTQTSKPLTVTFDAADHDDARIRLSRALETLLQVPESEDQLYRCDKCTAQIAGVNFEGHGHAYCAAGGVWRLSPKSRTPVSDAAWRAKYPDGVPVSFLEPYCPRCDSTSGKVHHDTHKLICDGCGRISEID